MTQQPSETDQQPLATELPLSAEARPSSWQIVLYNIGKQFPIVGNALTRALGDQAITIEAILQDSADLSSDRQTRRRNLSAYTHRLVNQLSTLTDQSLARTREARYDKWKQHSNQDTITFPASLLADENYKAHEIKAFIQNLVIITTNHPSFKDLIDQDARTQIEQKVQEAFAAIDSIENPQGSRFPHSYGYIDIPITADINVKLTIHRSPRGYDVASGSIVLGMTDTEKKSFVKRQAEELRTSRIDNATRIIKALDIDKQIAKNSRHGLAIIDLGWRGTPANREEANEILTKVDQQEAYLTATKTESHQVSLKHKETGCRIVFIEQTEEGSNEPTLVCQIIFTAEQTAQNKEKYEQQLDQTNSEFIAWLLKRATRMNPQTVGDLNQIFEYLQRSYKRDDDFRIPSGIDADDLQRRAEKALTEMVPAHVTSWIASQNSTEGYTEAQVFPQGVITWRAELTYDHDDKINTLQYKNGYRISLWTPTQ